MSETPSKLEASGPNAEQIQFWNETAGPRWVALHEFLDAQLRPLGMKTMEHARVASGERVLDIGCGCGATTVELGRRVGASGSVTGIDLSAVMLERARQQAQDAGLANVGFVNSDAQTHTFAPRSFDLLFSRFGVMFFADPQAAFANLHGALSAGGRLTFICWQTVQDNPWMFVPFMAALQHIPPPPLPPPGAPGPFSLADTERVRGILTGAGFAAVSFGDVRDTLTMGAGMDLEVIVEAMLQMGPTGVALRQADPALRAKVADAVLESLRPFLTPAGLKMGSAAWIVTAQRAS